MDKTVCRLCLCVNKSLRRLDKQLSSYFLEICESKSGPTIHLCCIACEDSLRNNLDFRNQCRKANQIFQEWDNDTCQDKVPIESIYKLLTDTNSIEFFEITKVEEIPSDHKDTENVVDVEEPLRNHKDTEDVIEVEEPLRKHKDTENGVDDINEIKIEFEDSDHNDSETLDTETNKSDCESNVSKNVKSKKLRKRKSDTEIIDSDHNDSETLDTETDKSDCESNVSKNVKNKKPRKRKSDTEIISKVRKKYELRDAIANRSAVTQFETVFDIEVFATYEDAKKELLSRHLSEPYLSAQHRCERCYTVYKNKGLLLFHMKWHDVSPDFSYECDICRMRFTSRRTLGGHKRNCHRGKFACKLCPLITYQWLAMTSHFQKHQGKIYKCHCDKTFKHASSYMAHRRLVHTSSHVCVVCARTFVSERGLKNHTSKMHPIERELDSEESVCCEPCGLTFANKQVYAIHVMHTDAHKDIAATLVACSICGLSFEDMQQVKEHKKLIHPKPKRPTRRFERNPKNTSQSDKDGPKKKNNEMTNDLTCELCDATGSVRWMPHHYRCDHPGERYESNASRGPMTFLCEHCGRGFNYKVELKEHLYVHSGVRPHRCGICPKAFRTKMGLKIHLDCHTPPSRECSHCGKKFNSAANLYNHQRAHTGDRRYKCALCGKGFLHRTALREHTRGVHFHIRRERKTPR